jgi:hypothetical protein
VDVPDLADIAENRRISGVVGDSELLVTPRVGVSCPNSSEVERVLIVSKMGYLRSNLVAFVGVTGLSSSTSPDEFPL